MTRDESPDEGLTLLSLAVLRDNPELLRPPEPVIPRLAWAGRVSMLAGREKGGKSTLLAAGAAAVSRGVPFLGAPTHAGNVLWLSSDLEALYDIDQRFGHFRADPDNVYLATNWDRRPSSFLGYIVRGRPALAVVDTLAAFAGAYVSDAAQATEWIPLLRDITTVAREAGTAIALAHHASKGNNGEYRDSTAIGGQVDAILVARPEEAAATVRRIQVRARWTSEDFGVRFVAPDRYELVGGELSLDARILLHVQGAPGASTRDVREAVGGKAEAVDAALAELMRRGAVRDMGNERRRRFIVPDAPKPLQDKAGHAGTHPGHVPDTLPFGERQSAGVSACPSLRGDTRDTHADSDQLATPVPCSVCGSEDLSWFDGAWRCEECVKVAT